MFRLEQLISVQNIFTENHLKIKHPLFDFLENRAKGIFGVVMTVLSEKGQKTTTQDTTGQIRNKLPTPSLKENKTKYIFLLYN